MADRPPRIKVVFFPYYSGNPYLDMLFEALEQHAVDAVAGSGPSLPFYVVPILHSYLKNPDVDVLHFHWMSPYVHDDSIASAVVLIPATVVQLVIVKLMGVKVVWTVHNKISHESPSPRLERFTYRLLVRYFFDEVIVHCESAKTEIVELYGIRDPQRHQISVIPHGHYRGEYPDTVTKSEARDRLGVGRSTYVYLFFGQIRRYKNVPALIEAFDEISNHDSTLVVAGRPRTSALRARVRSLGNATENVVLRLDWIPSDEVQVYFNAADVVVLPYRDVLTSGTAILAQSFGRPVIAPRLGCLPDGRRSPSSILYSPNDSSQLQEAMIVAKSESDGLLDGERTARDVSVPWETVATQVRAVYENTG